MKNALIFLLFFCYVSLPAQNAWDLFPLNQKTWWRAGDTLRLYYNDSTGTFGDQRFHYFGSKYVMEVFDDCFLGILAEVDPGVPFFPPPDFFYTWESKPDGWTIPGSGIPVFYPKSLPGEHWDIPVDDGDGYDQIRVRCTEMDSINFFGKKVLAKKFRLMPLQAGIPVSNDLSDFEMILTEDHGLNRFIPFHELVNGKTGPVYEMAGFNSDGQNIGLVPDFEAFTQHYKEGDLYKWQESQEHYWAGESTVWWHLDSLIAVTRTSDQVQLTSYRQTTKIFQKETSGVVTTDSSAYVTPAYTRTLKKADFQPLFSAASGWYFPAVTAHFGNMAYVLNHFDTAGALQLSGDFNYFFEPCDLSAIIDAGYSVSFDNRCGYLGAQEGYLSGYYFERLAGCRQGTDTWGDITPPPTVGVFQPALAIPLRIFPSIAAGEIYLGGLPEDVFNGALRLEIRQQDGRLGLAMDNYQPGQAIDISGLPPGIFILTVTSGDALAAGKAIKK